ncbi:hypothetical protein PPL_12225 [Heterostelium album PN500]|uniref:Uncharacterized protein n=1 Tax=Heterostelium pallidum (strain ATCC 26659 / Pp 5 / PN500) TaxID=670386 RepID=D3BM17_HETP5|nr:hypothetical protein PPL_12225 [Heterostelium album PN500]EFA77618.1 hypothetical protein PPL_12225 [Heterostelium album PN500]|eukprot:XP_020429746.1 hypothetical protein PPL_12225 [Heterostelium album PN500]
MSSSPISGPPSIINTPSMTITSTSTLSQQPSAPQLQDLQYQSQINSPYSHLAPKPTGGPLPPPSSKDYPSMFYPQQSQLPPQQTTQPLQYMPQPNGAGYYHYPPRPSTYMFGQPIYQNSPYQYPMQQPLPPQPSSYFYNYPLASSQQQPQPMMSSTIGSPITITTTANPNGKVPLQTKNSIPPEFQHILLHTNLTDSEISSHSFAQVKRQVGTINKGLKIK